MKQKIKLDSFNTVALCEHSSAPVPLFFKVAKTVLISINKQSRAGCIIDYRFRREALRFRCDFVTDGGDKGKLASPDKEPETCTCT
jgi:hypothetical protein